jgi:hypothetical protein
VESLTALVEETDGRMKLLKFSPSGEILKTLAVCGAFDRVAPESAAVADEAVSRD